MFRVIISCLLIIFIWAVVHTSDRLNHIAPKSMQYQDPILAGVNRQLINLVTLGHRRVYDNYVYIWLLQFLGEASNDSKLISVSDLYTRINVAVRIEPAIETVYLLSCFLLAIDYKRPELCESISLTGLKIFPQNWRIPMTQGYVSAFLLGQKAKAALFYQLAATRKQSPPYVKSFAEKLLKSEHSELDRTQAMQLLLNFPQMGVLRQHLLHRFNVSGKAIHE